MTWLTPAAWFGLGLLALPVLVHLFSRRPARTVSFPSLRFLAASPLRPTRRSRVSDWPLLLVRLLIVAAAVTALAQPLRDEALVGPAGAGVEARLLVGDIDSTRVVSPANGAGDARVVTLQAADLEEGVARATALLRTERTPRRLHVVLGPGADPSDSLPLIALPRDVAVRVSMAPPAAARGLPTRRDSLSWVTSRDLPAAETVLRAARSLGGLPIRVMSTGSAMRGVVVQTGEAAPASALQTRQTIGRSPVDAAPGAVAWSRVMRRVARDEAVAEQAAQADSMPVTASDVVVARTSTGAPAVVARAGDSAVVFTTRERSSAMALALLMAAGNASPLESTDSPPVALDSAMVAGWARLPRGAPIGAGTVPRDVHALPTDARWLWALAVSLLAVEWWMRRVPHGR